MHKLLWFTLGFGAACGFCAWGRETMLLALPLMVLLTAFFSSGSRTAKIFLAVLGVLCGLGWFSRFENETLQPVYALDGVIMEAEIRCTGFPEETDYGFRVEGTVPLDGKIYKVLCYLDHGEGIAPGNCLSGPFRFRVTAPGGEKDSDYYQGEGIFLLAYQGDDLTVRPGEQTELTEKRDEIRNSERIVRSVGEAQALLNGDESTDGAVSAVTMAADALEQAARFAPSLNTVAERLRDAEYALSDAAAEVTDYLDKASFDPSELDEIENRLEVLYRLSLKYGETEEDMLAFLDSAREELSEIEFSDEKRELLLAEYEEKKQVAVRLAKQLSAARRGACDAFAKRVKTELAELNMPRVTFTVEQVRTPLTSNGCDRIQFLVSANAGEEPKPMSKIASGGELSRIMLAINTVLSDKGLGKTQIFDEIDTGISGEAANKVGLKLHAVSRNAQVICVTHLAQIASMADNHLYIVKNEENGKTFTAVHTLDREARIREIARIIGGDDITPLKLKMAEEMLSATETV